MSTNKTANLVLNSWIGIDYVKRLEMNENFDKIDAKFAGAGGHSHDGTAGNGGKLDPTRALTYVPVNKAGDTISGDLVLNGAASFSGLLNLNKNGATFAFNNPVVNGHSDFTFNSATGSTDMHQIVWSRHTQYGTAFQVYDITSDTGLLVINVNKSVVTANNTLDDGSGKSIFSGKMTINADIWANNFLSEAVNGSIELGARTVINSPYIDFHSSGNSIDYDARIIASGGSAANGDGQLKLLGKIVTTNNTLDGGLGKSTFTGDMLIDGADTSLTLRGASTGWGSGIKFNNTTASTGRNYGIYSGMDGNFHFTDGTASIDRLTIWNGGKVTTTNNTLDDGAGQATFNGQNLYVQGGNIPEVIVRRSGTISATNPEFHFEMGRWSATEGDITSYDGTTLRTIMGFDLISRRIWTAYNMLDDGTGKASFAGTTTLTGATHINDDNVSGTWIGWYKTDKTTRIGYVGGGNVNASDVTLSADNGDLLLTGRKVKAGVNLLDDGYGSMIFGNDNKFINNLGYIIKSTNDFYIANHANSTGLMVLNDVGDMTVVGTVRATKFLAFEGTGTNGGYSFYQDGSYDTGMFSPGDGDLRFYANAVDAMHIASNGVTVNVPLYINGEGGSFANSRSTNGYQKLPVGVIIQWGRFTAVGGTNTITYPVVFPTACTSAFINGMGGSAIFVPAYAIANNNFLAQCNNATDYCWIAIGY